MIKPRLGNFFSGSGTWELAAEICDMEVVFESEIEPFPIAVEAKRFPNAIQLGDIKNVNGADLPCVDILCNSSPCQDLSVAGGRKGMKHEDAGDEETTRSGLFYEVIRITKEMRDAYNERLSSGRANESDRPIRYWCWENVPGAFSSNRGADFKAVLDSLVEIVQEEKSDIPIPRGGGTMPESWMEMGGRLPGEQWMPSTSESLRGGEDCFLSCVLMDTVPEKYFLSEKACLGILRRSQKRGKTLPEVLETALVRQAGLSWEQYETLRKEWRENP